MPSKIMGPQADSHEFPCPLHHDSRRRVGNGKDPFLRFCSPLSDIFSQTMGQLLRDKNHLGLSTTLGCLNADSAPVNIRRSQLKNFPDSHPSPRHQFQDQSVSLVLSPKDDLIDGLLFHDLPGHWSVVLENLSKHRCITGIWEPLTACVYDEGKEGTREGKAESLGGLLESLSEVAQEGEDLL